MHTNTRNEDMPLGVSFCFLEGMEGKVLSKEKRRIKCSYCYRNKVYTSFIKTKDDKYFKDGYFPICKVCANKIAKEDGEEGVKFLLRLCNIPFVEVIWENVKGVASPFGSYVKQIVTLVQYRKYYDLPYQEILTKETRNERQREKMLEEGEIDTIELADGTVIEYSDTLKIKYGDQYSKLDLLRMEKYFQDNTLISNVDTPQKEMNLITLAKLNLKLDEAFESGDVQDIKRLSDTIQKIAKENNFLNAREEDDDEYLGFTSWAEMAAHAERLGFIDKYPVIENADSIDRAIEIAAAYYSSLVAEDEGQLDWYHDESRLKWISDYVNKRFDLLSDKNTLGEEDEILVDIEFVESDVGDDDDE